MAVAAHVGDAHGHDHHGPPEANRSSRVEPAFLGMLLFIISEIVVSTLPENRSEWLEKGLLDRLRRVTGKPLEHVESTSDPVSTGA